MGSESADEVGSEVSGGWRRKPLDLLLKTQATGCFVCFSGCPESPTVKASEEKMELRWGMLSAGHHLVWEEHGWERRAEEAAARVVMLSLATFCSRLVSRPLLSTPLTGEMLAGRCPHLTSCWAHQ